MSIQKSERGDEGFSFMETLIVLAITIMLSAGIGIPAARHIERAKRARASAQIETFRIALHSYYLDCGQYPSEEQGLAALFAKPTMHPVPEDWQGPYTDRRVPDDPWGHAYSYIVPGPEGLVWGIASYGTDGTEGGDGNDRDINSWD